MGSCLSLQTFFGVVQYEEGREINFYGISGLL